MKKPSKTPAATLTLERFGSGIGQPKNQKETLVGLGLAKKRTTIKTDTPEVRAMVTRVSHLVRIVEGA